MKSPYFSKQDANAHGRIYGAKGASHQLNAVLQMRRVGGGVCRSEAVVRGEQVPVQPVSWIETSSAIVVRPARCVPQYDAPPVHAVGPRKYRVGLLGPRYVITDRVR